MPTTSAVRPASERQRQFIRSLAAERDTQALIDAGLWAEIQDAYASNPIRRDLIDRLMAFPRAIRSTDRLGLSRTDGAEDVPAPAVASRAGRMLAAGSLEATATLQDGRHVTVQIRTRTRSGRGWTNAALGEDGSRTNISILGQRVGWIGTFGDGNGGQVYRLTLRTRRAEYVDAIRGVLAYAADLPALGASVKRVQEASRCGRCFRTLTDPVSIDRGIGPECFGRDTGSQHVAAQRAADGTAAVREPRPTHTAAANEAVRENNEAVMAAEAELARSRAAGLHEDAAQGNAFGAYEAVQERAAYEREMEEERAAGIGPRRAAPSITELAARIEAPRSADRPADRNVTRARDLIAEALDAYCTPADMTFAMGIFDQLAAR